MMFTTRMKYLVAVVLSRHVDELTKELLSLGLLHFVKIQDLQTGLETRVSALPLDVSGTRLSEIRKRIESFLSVIGTSPAIQNDVVVERLRPVDLEAAEKYLDDVAGRIEGFRERQKMIQQEILKLEGIRRQVDLFGDLGAGIRNDSQSAFLHFTFGLLDAARFDEFSAEMNTFPSVVLPLKEEGDSVSLLVIGMKRDEQQMRTIFSKYKLTEEELIPDLSDVKGGVAVTIDRKIAALTEEQKSLNAQSQAVISGERDRLNDLWENLRLNELYYRIQSYFSRTARTVLFSGWVPASRREAIEQGIRRITNGSYYLEWHDPEGLQKEIHRPVSVPVKLANPKILSPFQMLVTNFSIPRYKTIDPTPIVAVLYLIMFGLMFGDVGQGFVILITGILGALFGRFKKGMREIMKLLIFCGGAAIAGGFAFGSFFGLPGVIPPLWFQFESLVNPEVPLPAASPVKSIIQMLVITLYFGIGVIIMGLILNWINLIRTRQWLKLVFDRTGLVGGWLYAGGVYTVYFFATHDFKQLPGGMLLFAALGLPALLLIGKPIEEFFAHRKEHPATPFTPLTPLRFFFEWLLELLEFFTGYLSNTLSFMRVAGLGIAHVALMIAFTKIALMVGNNEWSVVGILIYAVGNLFVVALEGLSAGIQSLRLNYYEFFSKYFQGAGEAYSPVSLKGT